MAEEAYQRKQGNIKGKVRRKRRQYKRLELSRKALLSPGNDALAQYKKIRGKLRTRPR